MALCHDRERFQSWLTVCHRETPHSLLTGRARSYPAHKMGSGPHCDVDQSRATTSSSVQVTRRTVPSSRKRPRTANGPSNPTFFSHWYRQHRHRASSLSCTPQVDKPWPGTAYCTLQITVQYGINTTHSPRHITCCQICQEAPRQNHGPRRSRDTRSSGLFLAFFSILSHATKPISPAQ